MSSAGKKIFIFSLLCLGAGFLFFAQITHAQAPINPDTLGTQYAAQTGLAGTDIRVIIANIIRVALGLLGIVVVSLIIYGGYLWMTAGGNEDQIGQAKKILINSVIGLAIILSAYAITSFVISKLLIATQGLPAQCSNGLQDADENGVDCGGPCPACPAGCVGPACAGGNFFQNFFINSLPAGGNVCIRNVHPMIVFSKDLDLESLNSHQDVFTVSKKSDSSVVAGNWVLAKDATGKDIKNTIQFVPTGDCGDNTKDCLEANTAYLLQIDANKVDRILSADGLTLTCFFRGDRCRPVEFTTGANVDRLPPVIKIKSPDGDVEAGTSPDVVINFTDDSGVQGISLYSDGRYVNTVKPANNCDKSGDLVIAWPTAGLALGAHNILANGLDWAAQTGSDNKDISLRPSHCYNNTLDPGEESIGPPACGGECKACAGGRCTKNSDCASNFCQNGICEERMRILGFGPKSGAPGTFVTIVGNYFGNNVGEVYFASTTKAAPDVNDPKDWVRASFPVDCGRAAFWSNQQVTVVVPPPATNGPIKIITADGIFTDLSNDNWGPDVGIFQVNNEIHPKLCALVPDHGQVGDGLALTGKDWGENYDAANDKVVFGDSVAALVNPADWQKDNIKTIVPGGLQPGPYGVRVLAKNNGKILESNSLRYLVAAGVNADLPLISGLSPGQGGEGEYITISGQNFGAQTGVVWFKLNGTAEAVPGNTQFPKECSNQFWSNDQVLVKFPVGLTTGNYSVQVVRPDGQVSPPYNFFKFVGGQAAPGICSISPSSGPIPLPAGTKVEIVGENFQIKTLAPANGLVLYHSFDNFDVVDNTAFDRSGSRYNALLTNANIGLGLVNQAITFAKNSGGHALIGLPDENRLEFPDKDFTVSLWYKSNFTQDDNDSVIVNRSCNRDCGFWQFKKFKGAGVMVFQLGDGRDVVAANLAVHGVDVLDNNWHHLVGVMDRTKKQIITYVDGELGQTADASGLGNINTSLAQPYLAINDNDQNNDVASIDDLRVYNRVLTVEEIHNMYLAATGKLPAGANEENPEIYFSKTGSSPDKLASMSRAIFDSLSNLESGPGQKVKVVPADDTISGPVLLRRVPDQKNSNLSHFEVSNCLKNKNTCSQPGLQCCADGTCQASCADQKLTAGYVWRFSTREIPALPRVVEECSDDPIDGVLPLPSPAPSLLWDQNDGNAQENVCNSAVVTVKFNTAIDQKTVRNNIVIRQCGSFDKEQNICNQPEPVALTDDSYTLKVASSDADGKRQDYLALQPATIKWSTSTWYEVALTQGITSDNQALGTLKAYNLSASKPCNDFNNSAYCFAFKTDDQDCLLKRVLVTPDHFFTPMLTGPSAAIRDSNNEEVVYRGNGQSTQHCVIMDMREYNWDWASANKVYANIFGVNKEVNAKVSSLQSTLDAPDLDKNGEGISAVNIQASAFKPGEEATRKTGQSPLVINPSPKVLDYWPKCAVACLNAEVGVHFNAAISNRNLTNLANQNGAVHLLKCKDINCIAADTTLVNDIAVNFEKSLDRTVMIITAVDPRATLLEASTTYKVEISAANTDPDHQLWSMKSSEDINSSGSPLAETFVWTFHTKDTACQVDKVAVVPSEYISATLRDRTTYAAEAHASPDSCDPKGQKLNAWGYDWFWDAVDEIPLVANNVSRKVASISAFKTARSLNKYCTNFCVRKGSDIPAGDVLSVCGNGVVESGESCDPPNLAKGCSLNCLRVGNPNPTSTLSHVDFGLCGDGVVSPDSGEQCDPPNATFGCSSKCLNAGTKPVSDVLVPGASVCGDNHVTLGEDCDPPNKNNNCSDSCLNLGTSLSKAWCDSGTYRGAPADYNQYGGYDSKDYQPLCANNFSQCGNGILEPDEDDGCDIGGGLFAANCNKFCLKKSNECDPNHEGCSTKGTFLGSSLLYTDPSVCGDTRVGLGEEAFCEQGLALEGVAGAADPVALVIGEGQGLTNNENPPKQVSLVSAQTANQKGKAKFIIPCGYASDADCVAITNNPDSAVGANSCCYIRPKLLSVYPASSTPPNITDNICPNTYIEAVFDRSIDEKTLPGNFVIARGTMDPNCGAGLENVTALVKLDNNKNQPWYARWWNSVIGFFKDLFGIKAWAGVRAARSTTWCAGLDLGTAKVVNDPRTGYSRIIVALKNVLAGDTEYTIVLKDGVKDTRGISIGKQVIAGQVTNQAISWQFVTLKDICAVTSIAVTPDSYLFTKPNLTADLQAKVAGPDGQLIQSTAIYSWEYIWSPINNGIVSWVNTTSSVNTIISGNLNGEVLVRVGANVLPNTVGMPSGQVVNANSKISVFLCENPWPATNVLLNDKPQEIWPYEDKEGNNDAFDLTTNVFTGAVTTNARGYYNFSSYYCADSGANGVTYDDLPYLRPAIQTDAGALQATEQGHCAHGGNTCRIDAECASYTAAPNFPYGDDVKTKLVNAHPGDPGLCLSEDYSDQACNNHTDCPADHPICIAAPGGGNKCMQWNFTPGGPHYSPFAAPVCPNGEQPFAGVYLMGLLKDSVHTLNDHCVGMELVYKALKRFILTNDKNTDAIGVQIFPNPHHLTLTSWYQSQNLGGSPQPATVSGYPALNDGNNIFVDALNTSGVSGDETVWTNVYLFSINADAKPETRQVFDQLIKNLKFNINLTNKHYCSVDVGLTCDSDLDCPAGQSCLADTDKMKRNFQRLRDLNFIKTRLDAYAAGVKDTAYPDLKEGSYLSGQSVSTWDSWGAALSNALGTSLPKDPINRLSGAGTCVADKDTYCLNDGACAQFAPTSTCEMHDPSTGWTVYERRFSFACATSSYAYRYIYSSSDQNYSVRTRFENTVDIGQRNWSALATDFIDNHFIIFDDNGICLPGNAARGGGEISTIAHGVCGDGVLQVGTEECDPPASKQFGSTCDIRGETTLQFCGNDCKWGPAQTVDCFQPQNCGNGKIDLGEDCDLGKALNGKAGSTCDNKCRLLANSCGNGAADDGELCDWKKGLDTALIYGGHCSNFNIEQSCSSDADCKVCNSNRNIGCGVDQDCPSLNTAKCATTHTQCMINKNGTDCKVCKSYPTRSCTKDADCSFGVCKNKALACINNGDCNRVCATNHSIPCVTTGDCLRRGLLGNCVVLAGSTDVCVFGGSCVLPANNACVKDKDKCMPVASSCQSAGRFKVLNLNEIINTNLKERYGVNKTGSCGWDCRTYGPYCGDGVVQDIYGEECEPTIDNSCTVNGVAGVKKCANGCYRVDPIAFYWWKFNTNMRIINNIGLVDNSAIRLPGVYNYLSCDQAKGYCPQFSPEGKIGGSYIFDGIQSHFYLNLGDGDKKLLKLSDFTLDVWVKPEDMGGNDKFFTIISKGNGADKSYSLNLHKWDESRQDINFVVAGNLFTAAQVPAFGQWMNVVGTYDGNEARLYINGDLMAHDKVRNIPIDSVDTDPLYIGSNHLVANGQTSDIDFFKGKIDEATYYPRALTDGEIKYKYDNGWFCSTTAAVAAAPVASSAPRCGDGKIDPNEACDRLDQNRASLNGVACEPAYNKPCTYCAADCKNIIEVKPTEYCGDGIIQANTGELCEIDSSVNPVTLWAATTGTLTLKNIPRNQAHNGWQVRTCDEATLDANLTSAYLTGIRQCNNCASLIDGCVKCGLLSSELDGGVTVSGTIINALDARPVNNNPLNLAQGVSPSDYLKLYPSESYLEANHSAAGSVFSQGNKNYRLSNIFAALSGTKTYLNPKDVCASAYRMVMNKQFDHAFAFPVVATPAPGQYDLVISPLMYHPEEANNIRIVVVWYGKRSIGTDLVDVSGFVGNNPNGQPVIAENVDLLPAINRDDYYTQGPVKPGIWFHGWGNPDIGTFVESYTVDTSKIDSDYAFYVRSNSPINNDDGYLRVEVYYPEDLPGKGLLIQSTGYFSQPKPVTTYFVKDAIASENPAANYWHVFNIKKASEVQNIRDRLVITSEKRTSPQYFDLR